MLTDKKNWNNGLSKCLMQTICKIDEYTSFLKLINAPQPDFSRVMPTVNGTPDAEKNLEKVSEIACVVGFKFLLQSERYKEVSQAKRRLRHFSG